MSPFNGHVVATAFGRGTLNGCIKHQGISILPRIAVVPRCRTADYQPACPATNTATTVCLMHFRLIGQGEKLCPSLDAMPW
jgi:hypothetical protein